MRSYGVWVSEVMLQQVREEGGREEEEEEGGRNEVSV